MSGNTINKENLLSEDQINITWHIEEGIKTTKVNDIPQFLTAIESADRDFTEQFTEEIRKIRMKYPSQLSISTALRHPKQHRKSIWFRGHSNPEYKLEPSIYRTLYKGTLNFKYQEEEGILERFKENALRLEDNRLPADASVIDWLALGQHYGLKTRLLDFSINPLAALAFAADGKSGNSEYVAVYSFDAAAYMVHFYPEFLIDHSTENSIDNLVPRTFSDDGVAFLADKKPFLDIEPTDKFQPIPVQVLPMNRRLVAQSGTFLMWRNDDRSIERMEETLPFFRRILIHYGASWESRIGIHLDRFGFTMSSLYADLSQAAHGLNRIYPILEQSSKRKE
ncbi:FRG domain-containing protein [Bifidobacterium catulorum]|uniref:FRG domain-containing protein n=1 Tax=Bifidobacterium catulorum TaxID=1630173 RepID=A0A2U2MSN2_9BIFI|nr:FRG domain-containing protein [Bifidobacterium catulorum]PWG59844.1 hypothetical protein DF200_05320 [Bifidobacterium catulorum]